MDKEAIKKQAEERLAAFEETADDLKVKLAALGEDVRADYDERIANALKKQEDLRTKLQELREARDDAWDDVEAAWTDVRQAISSASSHFSGDEKKKT